MAWGMVVIGVAVLLVPPVRGGFAARRDRLAAEAAERAAYVAPTAEEPKYNEGCWWLMLRPGSTPATGFRCQVFDPLGRDPSRTFGQPDGGPFILRYPNDFGIERPLPHGSHTVVWTLNTKEVGRATFVVGDDRANLAALRADLLAFRQAGQALLDSLDEVKDFAAWDQSAHTWAQSLEVYFEASPHLGKPEAMGLASWQDTSGMTPAESAAAAIGHRLGRIDSLVTRFGGGNA